MHGPAFEPLNFAPRPEPEMHSRARDFRALMQQRRTVRDFSSRPVPRELIEDAVMTAASAPSGANQQPWTFVCIGAATVKAKIRVAAEEEERTFYEGRAGDEWLEALAPLGTDWQKPFLETAPWLIACGNGHHRRLPSRQTGYHPVEPPTRIESLPSDLIPCQVEKPNENTRKSPKCLRETAFCSTAGAEVVRPNVAGRTAKGSGISPKELRGHRSSRASSTPCHPRS